jgi:DNA (cytosine-5)-methyltransferase 1
MAIGSLFSGIGGLELGLEAAGWGPTLWQVEKDLHCRQVLERHWPAAKRYVDVTEVRPRQLDTVDIICGGFPCQDLSDASRGRGGGIDGERSGLWREIIRITEAQQPRWVLVENVAGAAAQRWVPVLRSALWAIGYASLPVQLSSCAVGAPYAGARVFLAASNGEGKSVSALHGQVAVVQTVAKARGAHWRVPPSEALGVADGVPAGMVRRRLRAYGNAVVPQLAEVMGRAILNVDGP